jgi:hypothetical protein
MSGNTRKSSGRPATGDNTIPYRYTYEDLSNFHRTVLAILNYNVPNTLGVSDLKIVQQYLCIVTALLEAPLNEEHFNHIAMTVSGDSLLRSSTTKIKGIGTICKLKKCLKALVIWMREINTIEDLTLAILVDEYYTKFPYALKPSKIPEGPPVKSNSIKNKNKSSGKP